MPSPHPPTPPNPLSATLFALLPSASPLHIASSWPKWILVLTASLWTSILLGLPIGAFFAIVTGEPFFAAPSCIAAAIHGAVAAAILTFGYSLIALGIGFWPYSRRPSSDSLPGTIWLSALLPTLIPALVASALLCYSLIARADNYTSTVPSLSFAKTLNPCLAAITHPLIIIWYLINACKATRRYSNARYRGHCVHCGYSVPSKGDLCPECGSPQVPW